MLRIKFNKLKQVCATALLPKIFKDAKYAKKKIDAYPIENLSKLRKSTDSGSKDEKFEKQTLIIEKCFAQRTPDNEIKEFKNKDEILSEKNPSHNPCKVNTDENTELGLLNEIDNSNESMSEESMQQAKIQATTVKIEEEKLAQKLDHIDEVPHVEASASKMEGFNVTPKVLGHENGNLKINELRNDPITSDLNEKLDIDALAKRCLSKPSGDYDHALLNEINNISENDLHILNVDLSNNESVEKYFSQILEKSKQKQTSNLNEPSSDIIDANIEQIQKNLNEVKGFADKEPQTERFQPLHLDTVPLFAVDNNEKDNDEDKSIDDLILRTNNVVFGIPEVLNPYDMQAFPFYNYINKEISEDILDEMFTENMHFQTVPILTMDYHGQGNNEYEFIEQYSSSNANDIIIETSTVLNPYDMQAIPFYEYDNKENIKDLPEHERIIISETIQRVNDIALNEDHVFDKDDLSERSYLVDDKEKEIDFEDSQPPVTSTMVQKTPSITFNSKNLTDSDVLKLLEYKNVLSVKPEQSNVEHVLTFTSDDFQGDVPNTETQVRSEISNSAISGTFPINNTKQTLEIPEDTAISAHQNPDEYYEFPSNFKTYIGLGGEEPESLFSDFTVSQSMVFSTMPQFTQIKEDSERAEDPSMKLEHVIFYPNDPYTHVVFKPEPKKEIDEAESALKSEVNDAGICSEDAVPLSLLLKRLRERNRSQTSNEIYYSQAKAKPVTATCNRPLDKSKPKTTLQPDRCKPKPKPVCKPTPCPEPCPQKKDPCAKFIPIFLNTVINSDSSLDTLSSFKQDLYKKYSTPSSLALIIEGAFEKLEYLTQILELFIGKSKIDSLNEAVNVDCARNFEPWIPIPSWPIPKLEKKRPLVCPKDGCKLPAARPAPANINKPCLGMPKKLSPTKTFCRSFANPY